MRDNIITIFDFETSGVEVKSPIQIALSKISNLKIVDTFCSYMDPGFVIPVPNWANGIPPEELEGAPHHKKVMKEVARFMGNDPIMAHNSAFDLPLLDKEWKQIGITRRNEVLCSMTLSRRLNPGAKSHALEKIIDHLQISKELDDGSTNFHRADYDVLLTSRLFIKMMQTMKEVYGLPSISIDLLLHLQDMNPQMALAYLEELGGRP
jgi:DNA polymerase-3 subunit epsilon